MRLRSKSGVTAGAVAACLTAIALYAQEPKPQDQKPPEVDIPTVFRTDTRVVVCNTTVVDKDGHLVTNLKRENFTVFENNVQQQISDFRHEDVPVSLGLIIDNSSSMRLRRASVEAAALALVKDSNPDDEVFVVNFSEEAFLDLPNKRNFTNNIQEMEQALSRIGSEGGTAMLDAVRFSIDHLREKASRDKKVLVVVTDGVDNSSIITLDKLVKAAQQSGVLLYCVGLLEDEDKLNAAKARKEMETLSEATGGESYFPAKLEEVDQIAHTVAHDIRNQYTIQYVPSNSTMDGSYRKIKITVNAPGKLTVRTRSGYYASPDQSKPAAKGSNLR